MVQNDILEGWTRSSYKKNQSNSFDDDWKNGERGAAPPRDLMRDVSRVGRSPNHVTVLQI